MRIKKVVLVIVIFCMGTAMAMAISGHDDVPANAVGAITKNHTSTSQTGVGQHEPAQTDLRLGLTTIKRNMPKNIRASGLFQSKSWYAPPPYSVPSPEPSAISLLPPPPPSAPQLPFAFIGRMIDGNEVLLFLTNGDRQYTVKYGDIFEDSYRVDEITSTKAVLTYLPMNIQQELVFNSTAVGVSALSTSATIAVIQSSAQSQQQINTIR